MNKSEQKRFDVLYRNHLRALKLKGMSDKTIEAYSRAVRRPRCSHLADSR